MPPGDPSNQADPSSSVVDLRRNRRFLDSARHSQCTRRCGGWQNAAIWKSKHETGSVS